MLSMKAWLKINKQTKKQRISSSIPNTEPCSPPSIRPRSRSRDSGDENENIQERHFRPHFLQAPGDLIVQEGRLCRMDCKVNGRLVTGPEGHRALKGHLLTEGGEVHSLECWRLAKHQVTAGYTVTRRTKSQSLLEYISLIFNHRKSSVAEIFFLGEFIPEGHLSSR